MNAKTAQSLFGATAAPKKPPVKEEPALNLKSTNESLVKKNLQLKQQLVQCTKAMEKLRNENVALRERNQGLIDATLDEKIERIVEERLKKRLAHAAVLHRKLVTNIQQTGLELGAIFKDWEPEPSGLVTRRAPKMEVNLERVEESPPRQHSGSTETFEGVENETLMDVEDMSIISSSQNLECGTPRMKQRASKGRRSELFQSFQENIPEEAPSTSSSAVPRRGPMLIAPSATPGLPAKKPARSAPTPRFKKPSTPAPPPVSEDSEMTSTTQVRRQRSAKMNIKSMKEPSSNTKLRRPGKHDEPMPYIDTFF